MSTMRGAVTLCLGLVCIIALLAEQAEGHITFFSLKEMRELREKESKKDADLRAESSLIDEVSPEDAGGETVVRIHGQNVETGLKLNAQKSQIGSAFSKMLQIILEEAKTEK
ncbi:motilin-like isoform X1 [Misgurnus anguillicaudatus]|uniref:motilin-like isoform X1 n=1 Tax=Misgurnus anguillicaudatus TaxID=75329 RepID=UPI003CCF3F1D